jgi:hypothetical protein
MPGFLRRTLISQDHLSGSSVLTRQVEVVTDLSSRCECSYEELSPEEQSLWDDATDSWHQCEVRVALLPAALRPLVEDGVRRMKTSQFMPTLKDVGQVEYEAVVYRNQLESLVQDAKSELRLRALELGDEEAMRSVTREELTEMLESHDARKRMIALRLTGRVNTAALR